MAAQTNATAGIFHTMPAIPHPETSLTDIDNICSRPKRMERKGPAVRAEEPT
jgi:hypothetical protein